MATMDDQQQGMGAFPMPDLPVVQEIMVGLLSRMSDLQQEKKSGKPVVWSSSLMTPKEILYAMDVPSMCQDVLGGWAAMFQLSGKYCQVAEEMGISRDACSYHRIGIGLACSENRGDMFDTTFVPPDLVISGNFPCMPNARSFHIIAEHHNCPHYFLDAPINTWGGEVPDCAIDYYVLQLKGMIDFLEDHGYKMKWERLQEEVAFTKALNTVLLEIEELKKAVPLPMKAFDCFMAAVSPMILPRSLRKLELWERLRDELKDRVDKGVGVVADEQLRLLWIGIPPSCDFLLLNYPERHGAVVAKSMLEFVTEFPCDPKLLDPEKPLESIARGVLTSPTNPMYGRAVNWLVQQTKEYKIDGAISAVQRSCSLLAGIQRLAKDAIYAETGVPCFVFDLEGTDAREYNEQAAKATLDSFIETLLATKKAGHAK